MIFDNEPENWKQLQNFVGQMFQECGFETEISKVVPLVRGKKEIDVYTQDVKSEYKPIILIECKFWNKPVSQETIHSFRTVVNDFGANTGFIVSKNGFQSGSYEAVKNTNIKLVSLKELEAEYYTKWKQGMVEKYKQYGDLLFPYWDYPGKMPQKDSEFFNYENVQLVYSAYKPICSLGSGSLFSKGFKINYPIQVPIINDRFEIIDSEIISTDRQYFDFVEKYKEKSLYHFKKLYGE
jgi:hypothetical protein